MPIEVLRNETEVKNVIFETEREIANKILFTPAPKNHGRNSIKENYPFPYYDSTYYAKVLQISQLKNKVQFLKNQLDDLEDNKPEEHKINNDIPTYNNNTISNSNINNNLNLNNFNYRVSSDLNSLENHNFNEVKNKNEIESSNKPKINHDNTSNRNKNNDLHLFVIINNDTFPHKLADIESKLGQNSYNYTEKNFTYEDSLKEQIQSLDNVYAKRKDQLANFNNEMKSNLKDVHDKK